MRLRARLLSLASRVRRPGVGPLAALVALAGAAMALGMATGSSHGDGKPPAGSTVAPRAADARLVVPETAVLKRVAERHRRRPRRGGAAYYRRTARRHVPPKAPAEFLPLYREAERVHGVNWRLLASIHRQETAFSTAPSSYHGLNPFGCCAGPMQFNVTNGPPSTWKRYRQAFREGRRPKRYPHRTRSHPSVYDDFDAIMAAGSLLSDSGAGRWLDYGAWSAAYAYYGHDLFGVTYANQVLARAEAWQRDGFCPNCGLDDGLVAEFDEAYGETVRRELLAAERQRKEHERRKHGRDRKDLHRKRRHRKRDGRSDDRARHRSPAGRRRRSRSPSAKRNEPTHRRRSGPAKPSPPPAAPTQPSTTPSDTPPPPSAGECNLVRKLLGC